MAKDCPKFTHADRKDLAVAAFLYYIDREYHVELIHPSLGMYFELRVVREDTRTLEQCPLLDWPFITSKEYRVDCSDIVTTWTIPL